MGELLDHLKSRYGKSVSVSEVQMAKTAVKNAIMDMCDTHLSEVGDLLTFEVLPKDLSYAISVFDEEPLRSKYEINQVSKCLFEASLKELEI